MHEECPEAFTSKPPKIPYHVGIIDGHLQLMRLDVRMGSWECFIRNQFLKPIYEMFAHGCPRVVLCFDDYANVPMYKAMTQKSRAGKVEVKVFGPHDRLPPVIPDDPLLFLMNRNFKLKLIDMLCQKIPQLLLIGVEQEFILDYKKVVLYQAIPEEAGPRKEFTSSRHHLIPTPSIMREMESMGESDVKFTRYVRKYGNALVHAIDGDYMAISLLYYTMHDIQETNKIFIFRHFSVLAPLAHEKAKKGKTKNVDEEKETKKRKRESEADNKAKKCWVDMQLLYVVIGQAMKQSGYASVISAKTLEPFSDMEAVFTATFLMLCAGTDFSRNIPLIGPKKIWDYLPEIAIPAIQALRGGEAMNEKMFLNMVVGKMYTLTYGKHCICVPNYERVVSSLKSSGLSQVTKDRFASVEKMKNTLKNISWVTKYWMMDNGNVDTPLDGEYGYAQGEDGKLNYADLL